MMLPSNIRLGWNALLGTNALAHNKHYKITHVKTFYDIALLWLMLQNF
jgi:hypothetical protein